MNKTIHNFSAVLLVSVLIGIGVLGCESVTVKKNDKPVALTTITILADVVSEIAGDRIEVKSLLPLGSDPHTYEPVPGDIKAISESDIVFYNGLGLELWLKKILDNAGGSRPHILTTEGLKPVLDATGHTDPHLWMNPMFVKHTYIPNIVEALVKFDPDGEQIYRDNARKYLKEFDELDGWIRRELDKIPPGNKKLVTTHDAFSYFGKEYGFKIIGSIWGVSTEDEPSPRQIAALIDGIKNEKVKAVFIETTINPKLMRAIAREAGVKVAKPLYGDSLGVPGSGAETYLGMTRENVKSIVEALK